MVLVRSMIEDQTKPSGQRRVLSAKIATGRATKAAADSELGEIQRAVTALFSEYFLAPHAACRMARSVGVAEDLKASAQMTACLWRTDAAEAPAIIGFDEKLIVAAADMAITRALSAGAGPPTAVDRAVAATLARRLATLFAPYGDEAAGQPLQSGPIDNLLLKGMPFDWMIYSITLDLAAGEDPMTAILAVPAARRADSGEPIGVDALRRRFSSLPVTARCIAGGFEAPLSRLLQLVPGEVFAIEWRGDGAAPLVIGSEEFAVGLLGEHGGRRAIKLAGT